MFSTTMPDPEMGHLVSISMMQHSEVCILFDSNNKIELEYS